jgi:tetraacyldisaccharide 4'-kinase
LKRAVKRPWLLPLTPLYAAGAMLRSAALRCGLEPVRKLQWPVISVGNLSVGGAGKTPFTIALAQLLVREGMRVDVLSRGYGRQSKAVERVDLDGSAGRFGDEPILIARAAGVPVYVGARRFEAGKLAEQDAETGIHLLDDGFQHRQLARQVDIVLVNSEDLRDSLLPAGNLREGLGALRRAHVLAVPAEDDAAMARIRELGLAQPVWRFRREMIVPRVPSTQAKPVVAFCGIARPEQFFAGLESAAITIAARHAFRDHHPFRARDIALLRGLVQQTGAGAFLTTEKDRIRLGGLAAELERAAPLYSAGLRVVLEDEAAAAAWLKHRLAPATSKFAL